MEKLKVRQLRSIVLMLTLANLAVSSYPQSSPVPDNDESASIGRKAWIPISAFYDIPLVNADVAVYDDLGKLLFKKRHATNNQGFYPAPVRSVPKNFRVTVTWDGSGETDLNRLRSAGFTLSSHVLNFDPVHGAVYVNPVTTLVSLLHDESKGHLTLQQARARVRQFLDLPPNAHLGIALRQSKHFTSRYFSQAEFLFEADKHGGVEPFLKLLVSEMLTQPELKHPFHPVASVSAQGVVESLAENLAAAALYSAAGDGAGWVMSWFQGPAAPPPADATLEAVENLQQSLQDLQSSITELQTQLADFETEINQKLDENEYYTVATPAYNTTKLLNDYENDLTYYAQGCGPLFPGNNPPDDNTITYCTTQKQKVLSDFDKANGMYDTLSGSVLDNPTIGLSGTIHLFSLSLGESVHLFRPYDSTRVQDAMAYWDDALTQAANLKVEPLHLSDAQDNPGGVQELTDFLGNPNATPPTDGLFQQTHASEVQLTLQTVPEGTVIDTKDSLMWATDIPQVHGPCLAATPPIGTYSYAPQLTPVSWNGLNGWTSPSSNEVRNLFYEASGNPMTWLINQSQSPDSPGFAALPAWGPNDLPPFDGPLAWCPGDYFWTRDYAGMTCDYPFCPVYYYYVYEVSTGAFPSLGINGYSLGVWVYLDRPLDPNEHYYWTSSAPATMLAKKPPHSP